MRSEFLPTGASQDVSLPSPPRVRVSLIDLHTYQNESWLGTLEGGEIHLSPWGQVVAEEWLRAATCRKDFVLDAWRIQPSCIRGIVLLPQVDLFEGSLAMTTALPQEKPWALSSFIASFKAAAAKRVNLLRNQPGRPVWERGYHEHLIPDDVTLERLRQQL